MIRRGIKSFTQVPDFNELPLQLKTTILQVEFLVLNLLVEDGCLPTYLREVTPMLQNELSFDRVYNCIFYRKILYTVQIGFRVSDSVYYRYD